MGERVLQPGTTDLNVNLTTITTQPSNNLSFFTDTATSTSFVKHLNTRNISDIFDDSNGLRDEVSSGGTVIVFQRRGNLNKEVIVTTGAIGFVFRSHHLCGNHLPKNTQCTSVNG